MADLWTFPWSSKRRWGLNFMRMGWYGSDGACWTPELGPTVVIDACIHLLAGLAFFPVGGYLSGALEWAHLVHHKEEVYKNCSTRKKPCSTREPVYSLLLFHTTFLGPRILSMWRDDWQILPKSNGISWRPWVSISPTGLSVSHLGNGKSKAWDWGRDQWLGCSLLLSQWKAMAFGQWLEWQSSMSKLWRNECNVRWATAYSCFTDLSTEMQWWYDGIMILCYGIPKDL